jgi:hypothetical protein
VIKDPDHKDTKDTKEIDYIGAETKKVKTCEAKTNVDQGFRPEPQRAEEKVEALQG